MSEFENLTAPPPPPSGEISQDQRTMGMFAHLLALFTGWVGPLILWLINKDDQQKRFVVDQAKEALNFQLTLLILIIIVSVVGGILSFITMGLFGIVMLLIFAAIFIVHAVSCIIAAMKANSGEAYRYPLTLRLIK